MNPLVALLLVLLFLASPLAAQDDMTIVLHFKPDVKNGRQVYGVCARCHLPEAWGTKDGTYPQLAGQLGSVLLKQLLDIREGRRRSSLMWPFVQPPIVGGYQNLVDVVAYIEQLPMTPDHGKGPWPEPTPEYEQGKQLYRDHCATCHGKQGEGDAAKRIPRLQGQHYAYMRRQVINAKRGLRKVDPGMSAVILKLSDEQVTLAVNYVSRIEVPKQDLAPSVSWRNPDFSGVKK